MKRRSSLPLWGILFWCRSWDIDPCINKLDDEGKAFSTTYKREKCILLTSLYCSHFKAWYHVHSMVYWTIDTEITLITFLISWAASLFIIRMKIVSWKKAISIFFGEHDRLDGENVQNVRNSASLKNIGKDCECSDYVIYSSRGKVFYFWLHVVTDVIWQNIIFGLYTNMNWILSQR